MQSLAHYVVKGETLKRGFDISGNLIGLVNSFLTITYLSVFHFGLYQLVLAFVAIVDGFNVKNLDGPVATEMRHHLNAGERDKAKKIFKEIAWWRLGFSVLVGAAIFAGSHVIADWYGDDISLLLKIVSPLIVLYSLQSLETIFLKSVISFAYWSFPAIREIAKLAILLALLIFSQINLAGVVTAHVGGEAVAIVLVGVAAFWKRYRAVFASVAAWPQSLLREFLKTHGGWIFLQFGLSRITKNTMPWFIKFFINTEAVAFYSLGLNLVSMVEGLMPIAGISTAFLVKLGRTEELAFLFKRSVKYSLWLGALFLALALAFVPPVISFIFPRYQPAIPLFLLMAFALLPYGFYKILKSIIATLREYKLMAMRMMSEALTIPVGAAIFLPTLGIFGAGVVYILVYLERVFVFYTQLIKRHPEFRLKIFPLFRFDKEDRAILVKAFVQLWSWPRSFFRKT